METALRRGMALSRCGDASFSGATMCKGMALMRYAKATFGIDKPRRRNVLRRNGIAWRGFAVRSNAKALNDSDQISNGTALHINEVQRKGTATSGDGNDLRSLATALLSLAEICRGVDTKSNDMTCKGWVSH